MKAKFGSIITEGSGKIGGHHVGTNRGTSILSTKRNASKNTSKMQAYQRSLYAQVNAYWQTLTTEQRGLWNKFPSFYATGQNLFFARNLALLRVGASIVEEPVDAPEPFIDQVFRITFCPSESHLMIECPLVIEPNTKLIVFATKVLSNGVSSTSKYYRYIASYGVEKTFPLNVYNDWATIFGTGIGESGKIRVQLQIIDTTSGVCSQVFSYDVVLQSALTLFAFGNGTASKVVKSVDSGESFSAFYTSPTGTGVNGSWQGLGDKLVFSEAGSNNIRAVDVNTLSTQLIRSSVGAQIITDFSKRYGWHVVLSILNTTSCMALNLKLESTQNFSSSAVFTAFLKLAYGRNGVISFAPNNTSYAARSKDYGNSFSDYFNLAVGTNAKHVIYVGNNTYILADSTSRKVFVSTDNGLTFTGAVVLPASTSSALPFYLGNGIVIVVYKVGSTSWGVLRSTNSGASWSDVFSNNSNINPISVSKNNNGVVIASFSGSNGYGYSTDNGLTWSERTFGFSLQSSRMVLWLSDTVCICIGTVSGQGWKVLKSVDSGLTWTQKYQDSITAAVSNVLLFNPNNV